MQLHRPIVSIWFPMSTTANTSIVRRLQSQHVKHQESEPIISASTRIGPWKESLSSSEAFDTVPQAGSDSTSTTTRKTSICTDDPDFSKHLWYRGITLDENLPQSLERRLMKIFDMRESDEIDEARVEQFSKRAREVRDKDENDINLALTYHLVPEPSDGLFSKKVDVLWNKAVPIPFFQTNPLTIITPLVKPKPDMSIGYAAEAFTRDHLEVIRSLHGARPDKTTMQCRAQIIISHFLS